MELQFAITLLVEMTNASTFTFPHINIMIKDKYRRKFLTNERIQRIFCFDTEECCLFPVGSIRAVRFQQLL